MNLICLTLLLLLFSSPIVLVTTTNAKMQRIFHLLPKDLLDTHNRSSSTNSSRGGHEHTVVGTVREVTDGEQPSNSAVQIRTKIRRISTVAGAAAAAVHKNASSANNGSNFVGVGTVHELGQLPTPHANVQIGAQFRKIILMKREANPLDRIDKLIVVDEGEGGARKGRKAHQKAAPKKNGKVTTTTQAPPSISTASTPIPPTTSTIAVSTPKPNENGAAAAGPTTTEAKSQAKTVPQGPPMPPPKAAPAPPPPHPPVPSPPPQQPVIVPSKPTTQQQSSGMALPMPIGVGGKLPNYKLIYFDARGICEPIRLIFHFSKVPFDDVRISRKQWLALKDSTVYGKVPILEVDGRPLTYCHTIARYLARSFGLAGRTDWEQAKVDEISDFHADVALDLQPYMYVVAGFHQGDRQSLRNSIFLPNVEKHFPVYVSLLKQSGSGFFTSNGITWVDFVISEYMTTVRQFEPTILDKYPAIVKFIRKVQTQPQIFDYITNRENLPVQ